jgi:hypothetical protein
MGKQKAAEIRKQLKTLGYSARDVSVRSDHNSLDITIRRNGLNVKAIRDIANSFENIRRCEASGEILSGGNTYVFIRFSDEITDAMTQFVKKLANDAGLQTKGWARFTVGEYEYEISSDDRRVRAVLCSSNGIGSNLGGMLWSVDQAVAAVVNHNLNAE